MSEQQAECLPKVINFDEMAMPVERVIKQVTLIQDVMKRVMKDGEHYGKIPGCGPKPSLLKPGAEKLSMTFRLAPSYEVKVRDWPGGHREYQITCTLTHIPTGQVVGQGVGACSTMEGKYRYRIGEMEFTGQAVPKDYWTDRNPELLGGKGFGVKKNPDTGKWEIARIGEKVEHDNPADYFNTALKIGKKRAHVDAILTCTSASDIFTQDVEDLAENGVIIDQKPPDKDLKPQPTAIEKFDSFIVDKLKGQKEPVKKAFDEYLTYLQDNNGIFVEEIKETVKDLPSFWSDFVAWQTVRVKGKQ